jgi:pyruvate/2-oxoglutarate dehydrogenase complex dihydrolipoamide acyltransferase (E2) component
MRSKYARRVPMTGMQQIMIDLKPQRCVSDVYINQKMDLTELCKYVEKKKKENPDLTFFHAFLAALGKLYYNRPYLNRFVANRHMYEHKDVVISFVAKIAFEDEAEEMMILVKIDKNDNINTISKKVLDKVKKIRESKKDKVDKAGANAAIDTLGKLPNLIRVPIVGLLKWMDKKGVLPLSLVEDNLYYSSIIVSNLGSIGCGAIFHNITDFGNASALATMGVIRDEEVLINGKKEIRKICEFGVNLDERIGDGFYFLKSIQLLQYIFDNPELLEGDANEKIERKQEK